MTKPLTERFDLERFRVDVLESRERMALTQKQLAETVGISKVTLRAIESGTAKQPQAVTLEKLCEALGLSLGDYAVLKDTPEEVVQDVAESQPMSLEAAQAEIKNLKEQLATMRQQFAHVKEENDKLWADIKALCNKEDAALNIQPVKVQLENAQAEVRELRDVVNIKNRSIQEDHRRADGLQVALNEDDRLIFHLITFVQRLRDGDVRR